MTPKRWSQIKEIFVSVLDRSPEDRQSAVSEACHGDLELQAELRQLLDQHDEMGQFLDGDSPASASSLLSPGYLLANRYEVVSLLGTGGMGEVYEVEDKELGGRVALKVIHPQMLFDRSALERFRREVHIARKITHPNVCRVFDIGHHPQQGREIIFLTMELVDGETLATRLKRVGRIEPKESFTIAQQLCQALDAAHHAGILHRDFKCGNVMLIGYGEKVRAVVTDFGIARWMRNIEDSTGAFTAQGGIFGTPAYMSPEQIQGKDLTPASDIYSLGLVLYEMVTGVRPFKDETLWAEALKRLAETPVAPSKLVPDLDRSWTDTILGCLERDPVTRFASIQQATASLQGKNRSISVVRKHRFLAALAALLLASASSAIMFRSRIFSSPLPVEKRMAVLPFKFAGIDPANQAVVYALSESLTEDLSRLQTPGNSLWVVPWKAVKDRPANDERNIAATLGVNLLIVGELLKTGEDFGLHVEIKEASTLKDLRSQTIEIPNRQLAVLEDTLLERVSDMLRLQLPPGTLHHLPIDETAEPGAREFYEQGKGYLLRHDAENIERAILLLKQAIEKDPKFALAHADLAYAYEWKYRDTKDVRWHNEAALACTQALASNSNLARAHLTSAMIQADTGHGDAAIREYERALELDPADDETLNLLSLTYDAAGRPLQAEKLLRQALNRNLASWVNYNYLGYFYFKHAQYDQAEHLFHAATLLAPDNLLSLYNLAGVYLSQGRYQDAVTVLNRTISIQPNDGAYSNLGTALFYLGRPADAAAMFQKAADLRPDNHVYWRNLGDAFLLAGKRTPAEEAYRRALMAVQKSLALDPNNNDLLSKLALYHAKLGQKKEALRRLSQAAPSSLNNPNFLFTSILVYELCGQRERALDALRATLPTGYSLSEIQSAPELAQLRTDKRYAEMIAPYASKSIH